MPSLRRYEGYLLIDHRNSPGLTDEEVARAGLPPGAGKGVFEAPTISCSHCQSIVVLNPDRTRERSYCPSCDRYLCDACGALYGMTKKCRNFFRTLDKIQEAAERGTSPILLGE
jgi:hypothetical protein